MPDQVGHDRGVKAVGHDRGGGQGEVVPARDAGGVAKGGAWPLCLTMSFWRSPEPKATPPGGPERQRAGDQKEQSDSASIKT